MDHIATLTPEEHPVIVLQMNATTAYYLTEPSEAARLPGNMVCVMTNGLYRSKRIQSFHFPNLQGDYVQLRLEETRTDADNNRVTDLGVPTQYLERYDRPFEAKVDSLAR